MMNQQLKNEILLIYGMPRSGTTWLGKIFDSHPGILYLHEPDSEFKIEGVPLLVTSIDYYKYKIIISNYCNMLLNRCTIRINGKTPLFKKKFLTDTKGVLFKINILTAKILAKTGIYIPIFNPFKHVTDEKIVIAWKSIESCGRIGLIMDSLKKCKSIYIIRHPCGQIASVLTGEKCRNFSSAASSSEDYQLLELLLISDYAVKNKLSINKIKAMKPLERLAMRWVLYNEQAIEDIEKTKNGIIVRYEDICLDPVNEIKKLYEFTGLPWNVQTENFINKSTTEFSGSYYSVFKSPKISASKWKSVFTKDEVELIRKTVSDSKSGKLFIEDF